jgi:hypothetical protein
LRTNLINGALEAAKQRAVFPGITLTVEPCTLGMHVRTFRGGHFGCIKEEWICSYEALETGSPHILRMGIINLVVTMNRKVDERRAEIAKFADFINTDGEPNV